jgi:hypothetical protein
MSINKYISTNNHSEPGISAAGGAPVPAKQVRSELDRVEDHQPRSRIPFGIPRSKLAVLGEIPGFYIQWIDDIGGRILEAQAGGFEFVQNNEIHLAPGADVTPLNSDLGDRISMIVGTNRITGAPKRSFLMKIRQEHKDEDRKILSDRRAARMAQIKRGQTVPTDGNFYIPTTGQIKISHS